MPRVNSQAGNTVNQVGKTYLNLKTGLFGCLEKQFGKDSVSLTVRLRNIVELREEVGKQGSHLKLGRGCNVEPGAGT